MNAELSLATLGTALRGGALTVARCDACSAEHAFPTPSCFRCGSPALTTLAHSGKGKIFSWVVNHYAFDGEQDELPYTVLLVELDGGARIYGRLRDDASSRQQLAGGVSVALDPAASASAGHAVFTLDPSVGTGVAFKTSYQIVREMAARRSTHPAFELIGFQGFTYRELIARIDACAAMLEREGVKPGDRLAAMANNRVEMLELWLACSRIGAVFVPVNPALRGPILADMLELAEPALAVCEPEWVERLAETAPKLRIVEMETLSAGSATAWGNGTPGAAASDPKALAIIMFTSGTTGRSKGVMWSAMTINCMARQVATTIDFDASDRLHTALPMFHGNALILSVYNALTLGATSVVLRKFSASGFASELEISRATATSFLGSMTNMVLGRTPDRPFAGSLRKALVIPAPRATIEELSKRFGCRVATAYGLADAGMPLFSGLDFPDGACGRVYDEFWEAKIIDDEGNDVPAGSTGELAARPRHDHVSALGYWRMPEATESARRGGWIRTGDLMRRDAGGWFYFMDRGKDSMRRRGENVSSQELEAVFERHPDVLECAAYPVPSEMSEDEIMLAVVRRPGSVVSALELIRFAEPNLPYFAFPRFVRFMEQLPKNALAKVLKAELRKEAVVSGSFDLNTSSHQVKR
jgi:crotonobetaine/carnitine-CoA ligase